jgi:tryptophan synthase alpha chain
MSNRIQHLFETKKENILSIYFTAGYPNLEDTLSIIQHLESCKVDLIEIGFPYSDPLADGPIIQKSSSIAIENGMTLQKLFSQLQELRTFTQIPIILMGYLNPVMQYGESNFIAKCAAIGIDGIIIPDMPLNYYQSNLKSICEEKSIANILLITPETSEKRIREIDENSNGFIYLVSSNSITGSTNALKFQTEYYQRIQNMKLQNPHLIGFGVHDKKTFETVCEFGSGAIIGSAFIKQITEFGISKPAIESFLVNILE